MSNIVVELEPSEEWKVGITLGYSRSSQLAKTPLWGTDVPNLAT